MEQSIFKTADFIEDNKVWQKNAANKAEVVLRSEILNVLWESFFF
jgi:hypothetical protein